MKFDIVTRNLILALSILVVAVVALFLGRLDLASALALSVATLFTLSGRDGDAPFLTEEAIERAFWEFDAERKLTGAERTAFKGQIRALLAPAQDVSSAEKEPYGMASGGVARRAAPTPAPGPGRTMLKLALAVPLLALAGCLATLQARRDVDAADLQAAADLQGFEAWSEQHQVPLTPPERTAYRARRAAQAEPAIRTMRGCFGEIRQQLGQGHDVQLADKAKACAQAFTAALQSFEAQEGGVADGGQAADGGVHAG